MTALAEAHPEPPAVAAALGERAADYERMLKALDYVEAHWRAHPPLEEIAAAAGLSPYHFQRVFTRWTGASPKRLIAALTHACARDLLIQGASVMDAAFETGLSGPSRLHDVFIAEEAVTPGAVKAGGARAAFTIGAAPTPFGVGVFLIAPKGLSGLAFADPASLADAFEDLGGRFPEAEMIRDDAAAEAWAERVFPTDPALARGPLPLALYGSPWRRQVWRALLAIPPGETTSYSAIAETVCTKKAARAVGAAVGANPVSWLIPCHRVLAKDGRLTGYHWGLKRKRAMLAYEAAAR